METGRAPEGDVGSEESFEVRDSPREEGDLTAERDLTAVDRDRRADARDRASDIRDAHAEARDERADVREETSDTFDAGAASDRVGAKRDRRGGLGDRRQAADDRGSAAADRRISGKELAASTIDELTGARGRDAGWVELKRELGKAKRLIQPFTLAFIDVDGLKETNDSLGHLAGDELLRRVVNAVRANLRAYDLIVRYGGDEFVCSLPDLSLEEATKRFTVVDKELAKENASITFGLAELQSADDSLEALVARADEALYKARQQKTSTRT